MSNIYFNSECVHVIFLGLPNVPGIAAGIFKSLAENNVAVDMVTQNTMRGGRSDLSFLISKDRLDDANRICRELCEKLSGQGVSFATEVAAIRVDIENSGDAAKTLAKIFSTLASAGVNIEIINSTPNSVMCVVNNTNALDGLKALKAEIK